ncbi:hypothetical protein SAMN05421766_102416 [Zobellia uliginosa]|uniref:LexA-binding, inner membrane-associated hydrolase n=1 Tax=Zobellia uliginosa TaxID=143224 RepID=A0ABY1KML6_9FLAO|nr:DUF6122 family protein [Zobellia uliginosa]SIS49791.1 hypothetical protein SAMN05421766_102416 [Zobellia uliginosa]
MLRFFLHYGIHFLLPVLVGWYFYKEYRTKAILILLAGIIIDLDHLLASPIFDPDRCSIGFHPLHSYWAIALYFGLLYFKKTRIFGWALLIHILADATDCFLLFQSE